MQDDLILSVKVDSKEVAGLVNQLKATGKAADQVAGKSGAAGLKGAEKQLKQTRSAAIGLNYVLQDGAYIFQSFRMGVMAVSNNIPMLIQGMQDLKQTARDSGKSGIRAFVDMLRGPMGLSIAVSAAIFALQSLTFIFTDTKKKAKEAAKGVKESINDIAIAATKVNTWDSMASLVGYDRKKYKGPLEYYQAMLNKYRNNPNEANRRNLLSAAAKAGPAMQAQYNLEVAASGEVISGLSLSELSYAMNARGPGNTSLLNSVESEQARTKYNLEITRLMASQRIKPIDSIDVSNKPFLDPKTEVTQRAAEFNSVTEAVEKNSIALKTNAMNLVDWQSAAVQIGRTIDQHLTFALMNGANAADALGKAIEQMGQKIIAELITKGVLYLLGSLFGVSPGITSSLTAGGLTGSLFNGLLGGATSSVATGSTNTNNNIIVLEGTMDGQTFLQKNYPVYSLYKNRQTRRL
jgi:hypothetical protein